MRSADVRRHVEGCPDCAADLAWARRFRDLVIAEGLRHPSPEAIVRLADQAEAPEPPPAGEK